MANTLLDQRRGQMFPKLTAAQLARLERQGTRLQTHAGEILQELGEISRGVFVVAAGSVEALVPPSATQAEPTYELLYLLTPGDFTGEMSTLRGTRVLARIRVREAGAVLLIDAEQLRRIVQNDAELSELFMRAFILRRMGVIESGRSEVLLLGSDHSADTLRLREFLTRNTRPYVNIDIEHDADAKALLERFHVRTDDIPVVVCRGGELLKNPSNADLSAARWACRCRGNPPRAKRPNFVVRRTSASCNLTVGSWECRQAATGQHRRFHLKHRFEWPPRVD